MKTNIQESGRQTLRIEAQTLLDQVQLIDESFELAVSTILQSGGKLIVTGMGKSGIIGKKMAATFASTGTPSFFMHPGEAYHGDLGMVEKTDVILALSFSGETDEVLKIVPFFKSNGNTLISITGKPNSTLAKNSEIHLSLDVKQEACPLSLAPTSSTTATLAMGDALAVALMDERGFQPEDFARFHPGGSLGKKLLTKVNMVMVSENLPIIDPSSEFSKIISVISTGKLGLAIVNIDNNTIGLITDGDLRRIMEKFGKNSFDLTAKEIMTKSPKTIGPNESITSAEEFLKENKITSLIVVEENNKTVGVLQLFSLK
jgi:arabinose-5-phosphate isomerase